MKRSLFLVSLALTATVACAQQAAPDSQVGTTSSGLSPIYSPGKCHFRLKLNGGTVSVHNASTFPSAGYYPPGTENWSVPLLCHAGDSQAYIDIFVGAKRVGDQWIWVDGGIPFSPAQHFRHYELQGNNWTGTAITYDDTTGNESKRARNLQFCLFETNGPQVLCGGPMSVMALGQPESTSTLPKILAVLKTIEFVDALAQPPAPSSGESR